MKTPYKILAAINIIIIVIVLNLGFLKMSKSDVNYNIIQEPQQIQLRKVHDNNEYDTHVDEINKNGNNTSSYDVPIVEPKPITPYDKINMQEVLETK
jgi:hypothetical protein